MERKWIIIGVREVLRALNLGNRYRITGTHISPTLSVKITRISRPYHSNDGSQGVSTSVTTQLTKHALFPQIMMYLSYPRVPRTPS